MEGLIEYWLFSRDGRHIFGGNSLKAAGEKFHVASSSSKTVANGLYLYYRGSIRRAGLVDDKWEVIPEIAQAFEQAWGSAATAALVSALKPALAKEKQSRVALTPSEHLSGTGLSQALVDAFRSERLLTVLQEHLFGNEEYRALARYFLALKTQERTKSSRFDEQVRELASLTPLAAHVDAIMRSEPFLLVLQDVFDMVRDSPGKTLPEFASELVEALVPMREHAEAFLPLREVLDSPRMGQLQVLAGLLTDLREASASSQPALLVVFVKALIDYHCVRMAERGRDPLITIENDRIVLPVSGDINSQTAKQRLIDGRNWVNDYYLNTAANIYRQAFGSPK